MQLMELRTHSKMKWEGFSNWPPVWAGTADIFPEREEGALTGVEMVEADDTSPRHLVLTMEHRESIFSSVVPTENSESLEKSSDLSCPAVMSRACSHSSRNFFHGSLIGFAAARNKSSRCPC